MAINSLQVVLNLTHRCNLACKYCYYTEHMDHVPGDMGLAEIERIFSVLEKENFSTLRISLHGGEPLLKKPSFFREYFELSRYYFKDTDIRTNIQTNGTLIRKEFIEEYLEIVRKGNHFHLCISLDGFEDTHNKYRIYRRNQKGTFDDIMSNIALLQSHHIDFGCLCVTSEEMLNRSKQLYDFFKSINGIDFLDFLFPHSEHLPANYKKQNLATIYKDLFDAWFFDEKAIFNLRYFSVVISYFLGLRQGLCSQRENCFSSMRMISISPNGDVAMCDEHADKPLGNIFHDPVSQLVNPNHKVRRQLAMSEDKRIKQCLFCRWFKICGGHCPINAANSNPENPSYYCQELQSIYLHIQNRLLNTGLDFKKGLTSKNLDLLPNPFLKEHLIKSVQRAS